MKVCSASDSFIIFSLIMISSTVSGSAIISNCMCSLSSKYSTASFSTFSSSSYSWIFSSFFCSSNVSTKSIDSIKFSALWNIMFFFVMPAFLIVFLFSLSIFAAFGKTFVLSFLVSFTLSNF